MKKWVGYEKGINLGGWFSQCEHTKEHYENFIRKEDIAELSTWGIDHVRVPVDYNLVEGEDGDYKESGFTYLQRMIDWCGEYHLNMILDLHKTFGYSFDAGEKEDGFFEKKEYQERFYLLWEQFAVRFSKYEKRLAFELLNEVTDRKYCSSWNQITDHCIRRIRKISPSVTILVGGYWNNSVYAIKDLAMPRDEHIIYNFHCYAPMIFTHQGACWQDGMPEDFRFRFQNSYQEYYNATAEHLPDMADRFLQPNQPEVELNSQYFSNLFTEAVQVAEERGTTLYCGEYGVIDRAESQDALRWYQAIHQAFDELGIGRAAWNYRQLNFGLRDEHMEDVIEKVKRYL